MDIDKKISVFWFRRDLRLNDNAGLYNALKEGEVLPVFIFDTDILSKLKLEDARVEFIYSTIVQLKLDLQKMGSDLKVYIGKPLQAFKKIIEDYPNIDNCFLNGDYEPDAIKRDEEIKEFLYHKRIRFRVFKDQCLFEKNEILKPDGSPYTVYTPYKNKVLATLTDKDLSAFNCEKYFSNFLKLNSDEIFPYKQLGFKPSGIEFPLLPDLMDILPDYEINRNMTFIEGTSKRGMHLRFGTVSVRELGQLAKKISPIYLNELIWRDFFFQILFHFPRVESESFKLVYNKIHWRNNEEEFKKWCEGKTGYPLVDAGMRELNKSGLMHNRVRMVTASFLVKHLLIDWRWGEAYFAEKLLDYDLSANNGNWQWVAGCGCDAAPYFRIFNPIEQQKKFDPQFVYCKKWIPELLDGSYSAPMVEHSFARKRCLDVYGKIKST